MSKISTVIPLSIPYLNGNEWAYVRKCLDSGWVSSVGKFVDRFEQAICDYSGAKYAVACVNGTAGLQVALRLAGVKAGNEVIVSTLTFIAPVNAVKYLNAEPVFMDCDNYMNIDCSKLREFCERECRITMSGLKNKTTGKIIKVVIPVHVFGNPCDMQEITKIARQYHFKVIEDATESLGAYYTAGACMNKFTGTVSDIGVYSFNGNKIITTGGGGMVVTNNRHLAEKARYLTNQAKDDSIRYIHNEVGYNFRLTNLQAALGLAQLKKIKMFIKVKKRNYGLYKEGLSAIRGLSILGVPGYARPNYWFYSLIVDKKQYGKSPEQLMRRLMKKNIQTRPIWYLNHLQKPYCHNQAYKIEKAIWFWKRVLNLPCSSNLKEEDVRTVIDEIKQLKG